MGRGSVDDDEETAIFDSAPRGKKETQRGHDTSPSKRGKTESAAERQLRDDRERAELRTRSLEIATPTQINPEAPTATPARADRSEPIRVISMKTPADREPARRQVPAANPHVVKLRAMSELGGQHTPPEGMGRLAPPRDPKQVRVRRIRDLLLWGFAVILIGALVMLGVFYLARR